MTSNGSIAAVLAIIATTFGSGIVGFVVRDALRSGIFPFRMGSVHRGRQPFGFWFAIVFHLACVALLIVIGVYSAWRLSQGF